MNHRNIPLCLFLLLCMHAAPTAERINLESYASGFDSIPIAVLRFRSQGGGEITKDRPWQVIADDLAFSHRFHVVRSEKVDSAVFARHSVGMFIDGEYTLQGGSVVLDCYLHDAATMDLLVGKKFRGEMSLLRGMAHRYANQIMEMLFGERGPFESAILFVSDKGTTKDLMVMDYDGHRVRQIGKKTVVNIFPIFIDSNSIVWTSFSRGKPDLYKGSVRSSDDRIFIYSKYIETSPAYSPVTGLIAYASSRKGNLDIYTCNADGGNPKQLTFKGSIDTSPTWSPNGYQIAFTSDRSGQPQIYVMDADGINKRRLTFQGKYQDSPAWSPKGDRIAYASLQNGKFDIWRIGVDGSESARVTDCPGNNEYPTWSPDGSHIAFASKRGGTSDIYVIRPDGTGLKRITTLGNVKMPDWSPF